jgi:hypothetical protein
LLKQENNLKEKNFRELQEKYKYLQSDVSKIFKIQKLFNFFHSKSMRKRLLVFKEILRI